MTDQTFNTHSERSNLDNGVCKTVEPSNTFLDCSTELTSNKPTAPFVASLKDVIRDPLDSFSGSRTTKTIE